MIRNLSIVLLLSGCHVIATPNVTAFRCNEGGTCDDGLNCCADGYCRADCTSSSAGGGAGGGTGGAGGGSSCTADVLCQGNPGAPCKLGRTACINGVSECHDAEAAPDGTSCGSGSNVCTTGTCAPCVDGSLCSTNSDRCSEGQLSCTGGTAICTNSTVKRPAGSSCGTDQVCNASGGCVACKQNDPCTGNGSTCKAGRLECSSGTPTCLDGANKPAGAGCGTGLVCDGSGACITCVTGSGCSTNSDKCKQGVLDCSGGAPSCNDGPAKNVGDSCGLNQVCDSSHACVGCTAQSPCSTNPTKCKQGVTSCATGAQTCVDATAFLTDGATCDVGKVCSPSHTCVTCPTTSSCSTNPNTCKVGTPHCSTGVEVCDDSTVNVTNGTPCGVGGSMTCNSGFCGTCVQGSACTGNRDPCLVGSQDCSGSAPSCNDTSTPRAPGYACATGKVCSPSGACIDCVTTQPCSTNTNECKQPVPSCDTGALTCENGADLALGTLCSTGFCSAGACVSCAIGTACTGNPTPCKAGTLARGGVGNAQCVCVDTSTNRTAGQVTPGCNGTQTCNGTGTCIACGASAGCNPGNVCQTGTVSCTTAGCVAANRSMGSQPSGCNGNSACDGSGGCQGCNGSCAGAACHDYRISCSNFQCVDTGALGDGTSCGGSDRCCSGTCSSCSGACGSGCGAGNKAWSGSACSCGCVQNSDGTTCNPDLCGLCSAPTCGAGGSRTCAPQVCSGGSCGSGTPYSTTVGCPGPLVDGDVCNSGNGICHQNACCSGCWSTPSGQCFPGNSLKYCGGGGGECDSCPTIPACIPGLRGWQCLAGVCETCA